MVTTQKIARSTARQGDFSRFRPLNDIILPKNQKIMKTFIYTGLSIRAYIVLMFKNDMNIMFLFKFEIIK